MQVTRDEGVIKVRATMVLQAPIELVFVALTDYEHFSALSSSYKESRFIEPAADGAPRIYTRVEGCVWFFCRSVARYARLDLQPYDLIVATVEPEGSDVLYGKESWELQTINGQTQIIYSHDMRPDFWVPPVVGIWAMRRELKSSAEQAARRIEQLALEQGADIE